MLTLVIAPADPHHQCGQDVESTSYNVATKWLLEEPDVDAATIRKRAEALSRISDIFGVCTRLSSAPVECSLHVLASNSALLS